MNSPLRLKRDIERMLLTTGKVEQEMTDRDRGLLILSVGGMRAWAAGLRGQHKEVCSLIPVFNVLFN
jgi:hypothetical protein